MKPIRWDLVSKSIEFYVKKGYSYVELPWVIPIEYVRTTLPKSKAPFQTLGGTLVGSAEQSFLYTFDQGLIRRKKYVAATPCFRDDVEDETHQRTFFKVELIDFELDQQPIHMALTVLNNFRNLAPSSLFSISTTEEGLDVESKGIELGSYGVRTFNRTPYIYGTGLAEPRFSQVTTPV